MHMKLIRKSNTLDFLSYRVTPIDLKEKAFSLFSSSGVAKEIDRVRKAFRKNPSRFPKMMGADWE